VKIRSKTATFYFAVTEALMMIKAVHDGCHALIGEIDFNIVLNKKM